MEFLIRLDISAQDLDAKGSVIPLDTSFKMGTTQTYPGQYYQSCQAYVISLIKKIEILEQSIPHPYVLARKVKLQNDPMHLNNCCRS